MIQFKLNRKSDIPLYAQIREGIKQAIQSKEVSPGDKLPTVSVLSKELNVTQATILRAFEDLTREKFIISYVGRGTYVNDPRNTILHATRTGSYYARSPLEPADPEFALAARRLRMGIAGSLEALQVLVNRPGIIHFTSGIPDPGIASPGILEKCTIEALKKGQELYGSYPEAYRMKELGELIAERYKKRGLAITKENVIITSGSQQAIAILSQVALENRHRVIIESPCYMGIANAFGAIGHWVESLARDKNGPLPEKLNRFTDGRPSMLYLCTKLHNPMGTDISHDRVKLVKDWADKQNSLIISDEIFEDLYSDGKNHTSFFNQFGENNTVLVSSLSKSFMCGLRIGWIIASEERIRSYWNLKRAIDIGSPPLMQGIAAVLLKSGEYDKHIKKAQEHYRTRRDAVLMALKNFMPGGVTWTKPEGGMHMWLELPEGYSSIALFLLAVERGVAITPGPKMDIDHRFINGFKLSYGSVPVEQISEGVELLADAVKELLKNPPADPGLSGLGG